MGNLRAKAKREIDAESEAERKRRAEKIAQRVKHHAERAGPAAEFLSEWSGEHVDPAQLEEWSQPRPERSFALLRFKITLDGFDLEVTDTGYRPSSDDPPREFLVYELPSGRSIKQPADLLRGPEF